MLCEIVAKPVEVGPNLLAQMIQIPLNSGRLKVCVFAAGEGHGSIVEDETGIEYS